MNNNRTSAGDLDFLPQVDTGRPTTLRLPDHVAAPLSPPAAAETQTSTRLIHFDPQLPGFNEVLGAVDAALNTYTLLTDLAQDPGREPPTWRSLLYHFDALHPSTGALSLARDLMQEWQQFVSSHVMDIRRQIEQEFACELKHQRALVLAEAADALEIAQDKMFKEFKDDFRRQLEHEKDMARNREAALAADVARLQKVVKSRETDIRVLQAKVDSLRAEVGKLQALRTGRAAAARQWPAPQSIRPSTPTPSTSLLIATARSHLTTISTAGVLPHSTPRPTGATEVIDVDDSDSDNDVVLVASNNLGSRHTLSNTTRDPILLSNQTGTPAKRPAADESKLVGTLIGTSAPKRPRFAPPEGESDIHVEEWIGGGMHDSAGSSVPIALPADPCTVDTGSVLDEPPVYIPTKYAGPRFDSPQASADSLCATAPAIQLTSSAIMMAVPRHVRFSSPPQSLATPAPAFPYSHTTAIKQLSPIHHASHACAPDRTSRSAAAIHSATSSIPGLLAHVPAPQATMLRNAQIDLGSVLVKAYDICDADEISMVTAIAQRIPTDPISLLELHELTTHSHVDQFVRRLANAKSSKFVVVCDVAREEIEEYGTWDALMALVNEDKRSEIERAHLVLLARIEGTGVGDKEKFWVAGRVGLIERREWELPVLPEEAAVSNNALDHIDSPSRPPAYPDDLLASLSSRSATHQLRYSNGQLNIRTPSNGTVAALASMPASNLEYTPQRRDCYLSVLPRIRTFIKSIAIFKAILDAGPPGTRIMHAKLVQVLERHGMHSRSVREMHADILHAWTQPQLLVETVPYDATSQAWVGMAECLGVRVEALEHRTLVLAIGVECEGWERPNPNMELGSTEGRKYYLSEQYVLGDDGGVSIVS
ncbi:hypothetical protein BCR44DRAFT_35432 [Catenaria anguillulae PL171]|uniref:Uncharacterized protein n=1 Tax=Catenaria anguillulae PL171 TaxID=765915 RepID=A0A1Y2HPQ8_9FUNG|nr:hypothetical protein BCR44DRAFT_35432 [Catenaria anguillulae PL171]